jgi:hypothetical protein
MRATVRLVQQRAHTQNTNTLQSIGTEIQIHGIISKLKERWGGGV